MNVDTQSPQEALADAIGFRVDSADGRIGDVVGVFGDLRVLIVSAGLVGKRLLFVPFETVTDVDLDRRAVVVAR